MHASEINFAGLGDTLSIECLVDAYPEPKVAFWRDSRDGRSMKISSPIVSGGKYMIEPEDNYLEVSLDPFGCVAITLLLQCTYSKK